MQQWVDFLLRRAAEKSRRRLSRGHPTPSSPRGPRGPICPTPSGLIRRGLIRRPPLTKPARDRTYRTYRTYRKQERRQSQRSCAFLKKINFLCGSAPLRETLLHTLRGIRVAHPAKNGSPPPGSDLGALTIRRPAGTASAAPAVKYGSTSPRSQGGHTVLLVGFAHPAVKHR